MSGAESRRIAAQDALWLRLDRPENRMVVTSVLWTAEPVDPGRLRSLVADRLVARYPGYSRRPVGGRWVTDPDFDLDRHLLISTLPAPGTREQLEEFVAARRSGPLDPDHPLWTIDLVRGYRRGSAVVVRTHHAIADGIRLTQVLFSLLDPDPAVTALPARVGGAAPRRPPVADPVARAGASAARSVDDLAAALQARAARIGPVAETLVSVPAYAAAAATGVAAAAAGAASGLLGGVPRQVAGRVATTVTSLRHSVAGLTGLVLAPVASFGWSGWPGTEKTAAWGDPVPLADLSELGHATGTTVNDVCAALVAGAFDRYLDRHPVAGVPVDLPWFVPVSLTAFDEDLPAELGNHFALVFARLPRGRRTFAERLTETHRRIARIRDSYEPMVNYALQTALARLPDPVAVRTSEFLSAKAVGVLTNVPGPRAPMALAGARVAGIVGWAPCSGRQAITVCVFSYAGQVRFGFGTDRRLLPDPGELLRALEEETAAALSAVRSATVASASTRGSGTVARSVVTPKKTRPR
ncbi:DUF1298 domain-containing protein [Amycolatopsis panacis]|uniref:diacylglycerol O-acyltransferase n=1 Tax=Amycolatopsis panacis TaxID=2340917 RepID=A0A419I6S1_9PSEU|nr:DUF1298 domain-containing protein [Amycolatopsis panacis]